MGNPAEETYCHPNKVNSMTDPCFVNWLLLGDPPDGVPHPHNTKLRAFWPEHAPSWLAAPGSPGSPDSIRSQVPSEGFMLRAGMARVPVAVF